MQLYELFYSMQGEGPASGQPSVFVRLAGCNLHCERCDTPRMKVQEVGIGNLAQHINEHLSRHSNNCRVVITGGEPLLQSDELTTLISKLNSDHIDLETNGTIKPDNNLISMFSYLVVSPKKDSIRDPVSRRDFFNFWASYSNVYFKFVVGPQSWMYNESEIMEILKEFSINPGHCFVMPGGSTFHELTVTGPKTWKIAMRIGCNYSDRQHIRCGGK